MVRTWRTGFNLCGARNNNSLPDCITAQPVLSNADKTGKRCSLLTSRSSTVPPVTAAAAMYVAAAMRSGMTVYVLP